MEKMDKTKTTGLKHFLCFLFWLPAFIWRLFICTVFTVILIIFFPLAICAVCEAGHRWACRGEDFRFFGLQDIKDFREKMNNLLIGYLIKGESLER